MLSTVTVPVILTELLIILVVTLSQRSSVLLMTSFLERPATHGIVPPLTPVHWSQGRYLLQAIRRKSDFESYALSESWVDKDPRLALTRSLYEHLLLKRVPCLCVIRNPLDVARSLWMRDGFSLRRVFLFGFSITEVLHLGTNMISIN